MRNGDAEEAKEVAAKKDAIKTEAKVAAAAAEAAPEKAA